MILDTDNVRQQKISKLAELQFRINSIERIRSEIINKRKISISRNSLVQRKDS